MLLENLTRIVSIIWNNGGRFWSLIYYLASAGILHKYQVARFIEHAYPVGGRHVVYILFTMSPVWALLPITILIGVAFYREILSLERRLAPRLVLSLTPREKCLVVVSQAPEGGSGRAKILRLQVRNISSIPVKDCRAYLLDVQKDAAGPTTPPLDYGDSLELQWSTREGEGPIDLPGHVPQYVNLLCAAEGESKLRLLRDKVPSRYRDLFAAPGVYCLSIAVSGDGVATAVIDCVIVWPGTWDGLELAEPTTAAPMPAPSARRARATA
ncbi:MAG TPA: hypothetical protein VKY65_18630 [Alphaproteobacteria bacterium]|nr:hypothetical protein [Alphaproteobacteria bacterium]